MENHAHLCVFIGWNRQGGRVYCGAHVPHVVNGRRHNKLSPDEQVERLKKLLVAEGGMLDDGSGWVGNRIPFTNERPDVKFWQAMRDKDRELNGKD